MDMKHAEQFVDESTDLPPVNLYKSHPIDTNDITQYFSLHSKEHISYHE